MSRGDRYIRWFEDLTGDDVSLVGGKNASLGEMMAGLQDVGIRVPRGFAITTDAYRRFIEHNEIDGEIQSHLRGYTGGEEALSPAGLAIRALFREAEFPDDLGDSICSTYRELSQKYDDERTDVAVRSSATAEDLPEASFAGQLDTFLNIRGEHVLIEACRECYA